MVDGRSRKVLWAIIESYIDSPDPVGSRYVTKKYEFGVSPATIRNIMADLEDMGYLIQPHTSAGRVPTDQGYRFYVETFLSQIENETSTLADEINTMLQSLGRHSDGLLHETARMISHCSHYLGVASQPKTENFTFHKIELIGYKDDRIAVVLITDEGSIRHKIIYNEWALPQSDLSRITSYLNSKFRGMSFRDIKVQLVQEMKQQKDECDSLIARVMDVCSDSSQSSSEEIFISGFKEVVNLPDFSDIEKIKRLSAAIEDKHTIVKLIDQIMEGEGVKVVIGSEIPVEGMESLSLVASTYKENDGPSGVVGIIGPTRMNYQGAITIVDVAAKFLSEMLAGK